jgi:crossover junction endodeoxyribonuclease RuvC
VKALGIDPGQSGALALLDSTEGVLFVGDLPVHKIALSSGRLRSELDTHTLATMLRDAPIGHVIIERVAAMPKQGVTGVFRFGYSAGIVEGVVVALGLPVTFVRPQEWQKFHGIRGVADEAWRRCLQLYPGIGPQLTRRRDEHRSDAILLASYGLSLLDRTRNAA